MYKEKFLPKSLHFHNLETIPFIKMHSHHTLKLITPKTKHNIERTYFVLIYFCNLGSCAILIGDTVVLKKTWSLSFAARVHGHVATPAHEKSLID